MGLISLNKDFLRFGSNWQNPAILHIVTFPIQHAGAMTPICNEPAMNQKIGAILADTENFESRLVCPACVAKAQTDHAAQITVANATI